MIICGLKLTHDGAVALSEDNRLIFSVEMEKLKNNPRFTGIDDTAVIATILKEKGYDPSDVDAFVIDGWGGTEQDALALQPRLEIGEKNNRLAALFNGEPYKIDVAPYREKTLKHDALEAWECNGLKIDNRTFSYSSYLHVAGHIMGAYCSSPFAHKRESSYILVWDGGMYPRLYYFDAEENQLENLGPIFLLIGNIYTIFSQHFGPFKVAGNFAKDSLSVAGKVMAYIALGQVREELFKIFDGIIAESYDKPMGFANLFANKFKEKIADQSYSDEDILHTFHAYMEKLLLQKLEKKIARYPRQGRNLCLAGGCALNIKWNSAIRSSGMFEGVYAPPFPNDSGSAVGMVCCEMIKRTDYTAIDWTVYSGPRIIDNHPGTGWRASECSVKKAAEIIYQSDEPMVFLNGCAELGPRALGNRSILANPDSARMKQVLNAIKRREDYRPVSPICLEHRAPEIFDPGSKDPFMLFDHLVRNGWQDKIAAVMHLDGTARLQTINWDENPVVAELLTEYEKLSGLPLLCNTSANFNGSGFFPDVVSAAQWDRVNYIWCENTLYEREEKITVG